MSTDNYKIGISEEPTSRLRRLQTGNSNKLELIGTITPQSMSARELEKKLHFALQGCHKREEWFELTPHEVTSVLDTDWRSQCVADACGWFDKKSSTREYDRLQESLKDRLYVELFRDVRALEERVKKLESVQEEPSEYQVRCLTPAQVADRLQVSESMLARLRESDSGPDWVEVKGDILYLWSDLKNWEESCRVEGKVRGRT
jgi:hypothetical protein